MPGPLYSKAWRRQSREGRTTALWRFPESTKGGLVRTRKRTQITIETERIFVLSRRKVFVVAWCHECGQRTTMITVDEAAAIAAVSSRTIYRWVDSERLHFAETSEGRLLICRESLPQAEVTVSQNGEV
jgi:excisionase family DNA binding protein